jgi:serine/threonine-protein kinase RsbW
MWNQSPPVLPEGQPVLDTWRIEDIDLAEARRRVKACAHEWMREVGARDFVVAVSEIVTNAIEHGGGRGRVRLWAADGEVICEVADEGDGVDDLQAGSRPPAVSAEGGYGLWMARSLCRRVHGMSTEGVGTTVWLHGEGRRAQRR